MRLARFLPIVAGVCLLLLAGCPQKSKNTFPASGGQISVYFSPKGGATQAIVDQLNSAKTSVDVQAYSFTSAPIASAVVDAHRRGVKVRVILDTSQRTERYSSATFLANAGVPLWIDDRHRIAHNKIMIIDGSTLITGSFNFTKGAEEENAENLLIFQGRPDLIEAYQKNFETHLAHSEPYSREPAKTNGKRTPSRKPMGANR